MYGYNFYVKQNARPLRIYFLFLVYHESQDDAIVNEVIVRQLQFAIRPEENGAHDFFEPGNLLLENCCRGLPLNSKMISCLFVTSSDSQEQLMQSFEVVTLKCFNLTEMARPQA